MNDLKQAKELMRNMAMVDEEFDEATEHPYTCRCDMCKRWWCMVGPEDYDINGKGKYGPFTAEEIENDR